MQGKTVYAERDEVRRVVNDYTADCEADGKTVTGSSWEVNGSLTLGSQTYDTLTASAFVTVEGCGQVINTVTYSDGTTRVLWRDVDA